MKQNKQKALERLREIEEEGNLVLDKYLGDFIDYKVHKIMFNLQKEAQKIKDDWEDGCGSNDFDKKRDYCGLVTKYLDKNNKLQRKKVYFCPTCKAQNKEKEEICGRILG